MQEKHYYTLSYKKKEDYDQKIRLNEDDLAVYSEKKLKDLYPDKDYKIVGETFEDKKRDKQKDIGVIELNGKRLYLSEDGKHNKFFKKQAAFVEVETGGFVALLKTRILPFLLLGILLFGLLAGGITALVLSGDKPINPDDPDPHIEPIEADILTISGMVTKDLKGVEGATLSLQSGNEEIAATSTDKDGKYIIADIKNGNYNLVCTYGESVLTKIATVENKSIVVNFTFPANDLHDIGDITGHEDEKDLPIVKPTDDDSDVKAIVKITDEKTPEISVGGLEKEAMLQMEAGKEVDVTLFATLLIEDKLPQTDKTAVEAIAGELELTYYDFSVLKEVFLNRVLEESTNIYKTKTVLEVAVPFDSSHAVGTYVFRYHDGEAIRLEKLSEKPTDKFTDGTYYVTADTVYVYTDCFSTYAVGAAYTEQVTMGSDVITYSDKATVNLKTKKIGMLYKHDESSTNSARVELYLVGTTGNLLIAQSGIIPAGYQLSTMQLLDDVAMPSVNTYKGLMRIIYLTGEETQSATQVEIPLTVIITQ